MSGKIPVKDRNVSPRIGLAYSIGQDRPLVIRAGYGLFYTRIPQIYTSTLATDNGMTSANLFLDNMNLLRAPGLSRLPDRARELRDEIHLLRAAGHSQPAI